MTLDDKQRLYLILDLARYLADTERVNSAMSDGEARMAYTIVRQTLELLGEK